MNTARKIEFEERLLKLEERVSALEKERVKESPKSPLKEMTVDEHMRTTRAAATSRPSGPVPFTEDGKVVDPSWKREGSQWVQRNLVTGEVIQTVNV